MRITETMIRQNVPFKNEYDKITNEKTQRDQDFSMDLTKCKDEKLKLQAVVADLTQVNRRWQRYNSDMQAYIKKLQATIEEQQEQLNNMADIKAGQLIYSIKDFESDKVCHKCLPVIKSLRERIAFLDSELFKQTNDMREANQHIELLNLQMRLKQAYSHIEDLNRSRFTHGLLKGSHNAQTYPAHSRLVKPCSLDGHTFYECDSESCEDLDELENLSFTSKGIQLVNKEALIPSSSEMGSSSSTFITNTSEERKRKESPNKEISGESSKTCSNLHLPFNIVGSSKDDSTNLIHKNVDSNTLLHDKTDIDSSLIEGRRDRNDFECLEEDTFIKHSYLGNLSDRFKFYSSMGANSVQGDITCPHCLTVFPPGSYDSFKKHAISCQQNDNL